MIFVLAMLLTEVWKWSWRLSLQAEQDKTILSTADYVQCLLIRCMYIIRYYGVVFASFFLFFSFFFFFFFSFFLFCIFTWAHMYQTAYKHMIRARSQWHVHKDANAKLRSSPSHGVVTFLYTLLLCISNLCLCYSKLSARSSNQSSPCSLLFLFLLLSFNSSIYTLRLQYWRVSSLEIRNLASLESLQYINSIIFANKFHSERVQHRGWIAHFYLLPARYCMIEQFVIFLK